MASRGHISIEHWLKTLELSVYRSFFSDYNGVEDILWMTERDLMNQGIQNSNHRARLGTSLAILKDKYQKTAKEYKYVIPGEVTGKTRSNTSMSPIHQVHFDESQSGVRSWPSSRPSTSQSTKLSSPQSSIECSIGTEATVEELKRALEKELSLDSSDLRSYAWYHGTILRQRAEELVVQDGDFLVRDCISQPGDFVITCKWRDVPLHFIVKRILLNPDTVYERMQYCFEKETFDTIPDFVTYYVGSHCPLSESSGVIISRPVNRVMPLSYYATRYGIQCQIHYVAKALESIPHLPEDNKPTNEISPMKPFRPQSVEVEKKMNGTSHFKPCGNLTRMGSDPTLSPNMEKKNLVQRPNSGQFTSELSHEVADMNQIKPPPKPSRIPSRKLSQRPLVRQERKLSEQEDVDGFSPGIFIPIPKKSPAHVNFTRQISETRFSFLDRPSVSSCGSTPISDPVTPSTESDTPFTLPNMSNVSAFAPQHFSSSLLVNENLPLDGSILLKLREIFFSTDPKILACHLTRVDLEIGKNFKDVDLGLGVKNGLELLMLPQGESIQKDLLERIQSMKLFVAVLILTSPDDDERVKILNRWIEVAIETNSMGNLFGFTSIMLGLTLSEVIGLHSTWLAVRHAHTENAFVFETKLRPTLKALYNNAAIDNTNTCLPYLLSLLLIFEQYISVMNLIERQPFNTEKIICEVLNFTLPGSSSSSDFGLQLLSDHLDAGRYLMEYAPAYQQNGKCSLKGIKFEDVLLDVFSTEFHLRLLWGYRGSVVGAEQRHQIFQKVVHSLYNKCIIIVNN